MTVDEIKIGEVYHYHYEPKRGDNESEALVKVISITNKLRGIAKVKFVKVINDNTGNGFFNYMLKNNNRETMSVSISYLHKYSKPHTVNMNFVFDKLTDEQELKITERLGEVLDTEFTEDWIMSSNFKEN